MLKKRREEDIICYKKLVELTVAVETAYGKGDAQLSMSVSPPSRYMNTKEAMIRTNSVITWIVKITNATLAES